MSSGLPSPVPTARLTATGFVEEQQIAGPVDNLHRYPGQPGHMHAPALVGGPTSHLMQEDQLPLVLLDQYLNIGDARQPFKRCELQIVGGK